MGWSIHVPKLVWSITRVILLVSLCFAGLVFVFSPTWPVAAFSIALSGDGKVLAIGSHQGQVVLYRISDGQAHVNRYGGAGIVRRVALSSDGTYLGFSCAEFDNVTEVREVHNLKYRKVCYRSDVYSPMIAFTEGRHVCVVSARKGKEPAAVDLSGTECECGKIVLPSLEFWDPKTGTVDRKLTLPQAMSQRTVCSVAVDTTLSNVVAGLKEGGVVLWRKPRWLPEIVVPSGYDPRVAYCEPLQCVVVRTPGELSLVDPGQRKILWTKDISGFMTAADAAGRRLATVDLQRKIVTLLRIRRDTCTVVCTIFLDKVPGLKPWSSWDQLSVR